MIQHVSKRTRLLITDGPSDITQSVVITAGVCLQVLRVSITVQKQHSTLTVATNVSVNVTVSPHGLQHQRVAVAPHAGEEEEATCCVFTNICPVLPRSTYRVVNFKQKTRVTL